LKKHTRTRHEATQVLSRERETHTHTHCTYRTLLQVLEETIATADRASHSHTRRHNFNLYYSSLSNQNSEAKTDGNTSSALFVKIATSVNNQHKRSSVIVVGTPPTTREMIVRSWRTDRALPYPNPAFSVLSALTTQIRLVNFESLTAIEVGNVVFRHVTP